MYKEVQNQSDAIRGSGLGFCHSCSEVMLTTWEPPSTAEAVSLLYQLGPQQETEFNSDGSKVEALRKGLAPGDKQPVAGASTAPQ